MSAIFKTLNNLFRGFLFGIANVIPGVSGGTIAVVTGIYEKLLLSATTFFKKEDGGPKAKAWFLAQIGIGALLGIFLAARVIDHFLDTNPVVTGFFFFGLVLGSIPFITKKTLEQKSSKTGPLFFVFTFALLFVLAIIPRPDASATYTQLDFSLISLLFLAGLLAAAAMVIPGVSGSLILLLIGMYKTVTTAVGEFNFALVGIFAAGAILGLVTVAMGISGLLKKYPAQTYWAILGLVVGSLVPLWPLWTQGDGFPNPLGLDLGSLNWLGIVLAFGIGTALALLLSSERKNNSESKPK